MSRTPVKLSRTTLNGRTYSDKALQSIKTTARGKLVYDAVDTPADINVSKAVGIVAEAPVDNGIDLTVRVEPINDICKFILGGVKDGTVRLEPICKVHKSPDDRVIEECYLEGFTFVQTESDQQHNISDSLVQSVDLLLELHLLISKGRGDSEEADTIRDKMDTHYKENKGIPIQKVPTEEGGRFNKENCILVCADCYNKIMEERKNPPIEESLFDDSPEY